MPVRSPTPAPPRSIRPGPRLTALGLLALTLVLALATGSSAAQDLRLLDVRQSVLIRSDGVIEVDDVRTFAVSTGSFQEAFVCIRLAGDQAIVPLPSGGALEPAGEAEFRAQPCSEEEGRELVVDFDERREQARVRFHYLLEGSLDYYSDVVQWYWNIYGPNDAPTVGYSLSVTTPGPMDAPYDAFVHRYRNPEEPEIELSDDRSRLEVRFRRIPAGDGVEIRYLMDPASFDRQGSGEALESILEDEARLAGILLLRRHPLTGILAALLLAVTAGWLLLSYRRYGTEPRLAVMRYPFEPPSDMPPAAVAALGVQRNLGAGAWAGRAFAGTVMDLARRGFGEFRGANGEFAMSLAPAHPTRDGSLEPFEREALGYLRDAAQPVGQEFLTFEELREHSRHNSSSFYPEWARNVRSWLEERLGGPLIDADSLRASNRAVLVTSAVALLEGGVAAWSLGANVPVTVITALLSLSLIPVAFFAIPRWRPEVAREVYGWQGFRRTLSDYTIMKDAPDDFFTLWDRYYCYAAALGVARRFLKNLERAAPRLAEASGRPFVHPAPWLAGDSNVQSDLGSMTRSLGALTSALTRASASASSGGSVSTGGGGGGGGGAGVR